MLIIGILAAIAIPQYQKAVLRSKATNLLAILKTIEQAERTYYLETGSFTSKMDNLAIGWNTAPSSSNAYMENYQLSPTTNFAIRTDMGEDYSGTCGSVFLTPTTGFTFDSYWKSGYTQCRALKTDKKAQAMCATFGKLGTCDKYAASSYYCYTVAGTKPAGL